MAKIHGIMDVGKRSMANSQTALATVGHNIANRSTEGYSRQRVEIQAAEPIGMGKLRIGSGSKTSAITRVTNPFLEKQIGKERSSQGFYQGVSDAMTRVESVYNEQMNKGLNSNMSEFFNAYREFSNNPESLATRTQVKESGVALVKDFKRVHSQLTEIQRDLDQQITSHVNEINDTTGEIASLNEKIQVVTASGGPANDERDRRDLLIKRLGEKVNIRYAEGNDGSVTITAGNSGLLVAGNDSKLLTVRSTPENEKKAEGSVDIFLQNSAQAEPIKVTQEFTGGSVGGLLQVRDGTIQDLKHDVDQMAFTLATQVNDAHSQGYDMYGKAAGDFFNVPGVPKEYVAGSKIEGVLPSAHGAAEGIEISEAVLQDPGKIAAAAQGNSPGDNRIANKIGSLQYEGLLNEGRNTVDEFYNSMVGKVGIQTKRAAMAQDNQKNIVNQLNNIRESISGVSLDEEATKLIEFQKGFDASARLIKTADEMFDTVLNLKRM